MEEQDVRALLEAGNTDGAVEAALGMHGAAWFGYVMALACGHELGADVYQVFCIDLWRGLPSFEWRSSLRTWGFTLARHAWARHHRHKDRTVRFDTASLGALADRWTRTATETWRRTESRTALHEAIAELPPEDRELVVLYVSARLGWKEIASIIDGDCDAAKRAVTLRKRYSRIKDRLRQRFA